MTGMRGFTAWVGVVLGSPEPVRLAEFYRDLLGWPINVVGPTWVTMMMRDEAGAPTRSNLAFQPEENHVRPVWPGEARDQQMQLHLDLAVAELKPAVEDALRLGATKADFQPQDDVVVMLDPDGHPFCLYTTD